MWRTIRRISKRFAQPLLAVTLACAFFLSGFPARVDRAYAATFQMQTGYFVGDDADNRAITGVGFQPDLVLLKDDTAAGNDGVDFHTSVMSGDSSAKLGDPDADAANTIQSLDSDGFTIGSSTDANSGNIFYSWAAFSGSDCSASGTFCVGSYSGNGTSQSITSVGFQPDLVFIKRSGATNAVWNSSAMAAGATNYFAATAQFTSGGITSLDATGFSVGSNAAVNTSGNTYWYVAFKSVSGAMDVGKYTGNAVDNRSIDSSVDAGLTFKPDFVLVKQATSTNTAVGNIRENYGDRSFLFTDAASAANDIQQLQSGGGFQVGTAANVNSNGFEYDYAAFAGDTPKSAGSGGFQMANGSYSGNSPGATSGTSQTISGLSFTPDLVIIKHDNQATDQYAVFRTSLMSGDRTSYLANAVTVFTGGITAINSDGFTVGTASTTNATGDTYYWTAFGNAMRPDRSGGSSDFLIGQYMGTAVDNTNIDRLPMQPDFVVTKRAGATAGTWRTKDQSGDLSEMFTATAQAANDIQSLNSDGFQIGTAANVNTSGSAYDYFGFVAGSRFVTGQYTGTGASQDITSPGFSPDLLWVKKTTGGTARGGLARTSAQAGDAAQPFLNLATLTGDVTALLSNGFTVGTGVESNESTFSYQYAAWTIASPSASDNTVPARSLLLISGKIKINEGGRLIIHQR